MAAGEAVLDVIQEPGFLDHVTAMGERLRGWLDAREAREGERGPRTLLA